MKDKLGPIDEIVPGMDWLVTEPSAEERVRNLEKGIKEYGKSPTFGNVVRRLQERLSELKGTQSTSKDHIDDKAIAAEIEDTVERDAQRNGRPIRLNPYHQENRNGKTIQQEDFWSRYTRGATSTGQEHSRSGGQQVYDLGSDDY